MKMALSISIVILTLVLGASLGLAQMGGQQKEVMGSSQMKGGQMMSRDMMANMTEMVKHMNEMMEGLSHPMEKLCARWQLK